MEKVLWVKFGWSDYYRGGPIDGNFDHLVHESNVGHEAYYFLAATDGTYYCYVPPQYGSAPNNADPTGWTDPDTVSADYTLRPSELAATLALLVEVGQPSVLCNGDG